MMLWPCLTNFVLFDENKANYKATKSLNVFSKVRELWPQEGFSIEVHERLAPHGEGISPEPQFLKRFIGFQKVLANWKPPNPLRNTIEKPGPLKCLGKELGYCGKMKRSFSSHPFSSLDQ